MNNAAPIPVLVSLPCEACHAAPCGEDDIVCVPCRAGIRARAHVAAQTALRIRAEKIAVLDRTRERAEMEAAFPARRRGAR